jgi:polar amino acid transport system substrate-binding protein
LLLSIPSALASADQRSSTVKIGSYVIPGILKEDGTGLFNRLNNAILAEMNRDVELNISSLNRARIGITNGTFDVYFPELWENLPGDKNEYVVSNPIFYKRIVLFTLKDSGLDDLSDFTGKLLGAVKGFSYGTDIISNPALNLVFQDDDMVNIKLLLNKRISGVLGGFPGTVIAVKKNKGSGNIHYDLNKPVAVLESFYVCKNNADGIKLCNAINKAIDSLLQKGILELNAVTGLSRFNSVPGK